MATIYIGHASISENGTVQGTAGDQTGKEVCTRTWYSKPWDFMAIHPNSSVREKHAKAIEAACANNNIGYGQSNRNTLNTQANSVNYDLSTIKTACNCDCSSLQNVAAIASGAVSSSSYGSNGWTTSVMKAKLQAAGYVIITDSTYLTSAEYCVRGAIYVKSGSHTVCGLTNGSNYQKTLSKAGISTSSSTASTTSSSSSTSSTSSSSSTTSSSSSSSKLKVTSTVKAVQTWLNTYYSAGLTVDGVYGSKTKAALCKAWQKEVGGLTVDGIFGTKSKAKAASVVIKSGNSGIIVTIWQAYLVCRGYNPNGIDGSFGSGCKSATISFQKNNSLTQDGQVGKNTWTKAFA